MDETAFFGGSFDPPHLGHLAVASAVLESGLCTDVAWVPAYAPPHKHSGKASFEDRAAMVELTIAGISGMYLSRIEAELELTPSYTIDVLESWEQRLHSVPALLIGADSLLTLHTWHRAQELVEKFRIISYPRSGFAVSEDILRRHWSGNIARRLADGVMKGDFFEISSSELKKKMEKTACKYNIINMEKYLAEGVCEYIIRHGLYLQFPTR